MNSVRVEVPATSANLGPGFDVFGLALDLRNRYIVSPAAAFAIAIEGYGDELPLDRTNLFYHSFARLFEVAGKPAPEIEIRMEIAIPPGKGLGSSASAVVGGLVAANALLGNIFTVDEVLREAVLLEHGNHADNVAPALLGGLVVCAREDERFVCRRVPFPEEIKAVLLTPDFAMDTVQGRALLPAQYSKEDTLFSTGRVGLFLAALSAGRYDLLRTAMDDRLHQPYRAIVFPALPMLIAAALAAGAHGACLSGGGSSVLALAGEQAAAAVAFALRQACQAAGIQADVRTLRAGVEGATATTDYRRPTTDD